MAHTGCRTGAPAVGVCCQRVEGTGGNLLAYKFCIFRKTSTFFEVPENCSARALKQKRFGPHFGALEI